jgi:hypothetical protein
MIDDKTKQKLLKELEKSGNVWSSCLKLNIHRSTYYRWKEVDKDFRRLANMMERHGRENMCDIAKHALMLNVKDKKMDAIKYVLSHLDPPFKRKQTSNVVILHKKDIIPNVPQKTLEDMLEDYADEQIANKTTDTADSEPEMDKSPEDPQEIQKPLDNLHSDSAIQDKKLDNNI